MDVSKPEHGLDQFQVWNTSNEILQTVVQIIFNCDRKYGNLRGGGGWKGGALGVSTPFGHFRADTRFETRMSVSTLSRNCRLLTK
eukprot:3259725-Rhodomonas_salina.1